MGGLLFVVVVVEVEVEVVLWSRLAFTFAFTLLLALLCLTLLCFCGVIWFSLIGSVQLVQLCPFFHNGSNILMSVINELNNNKLLVTAVRHCYFQNREQACDSKKFTGTESLFAVIYGIGLKPKLIKRRQVISIIYLCS